MALAYIGVGANLTGARRSVERALEALESLGTVVRRSSLYRTAPWGVREQPEFVNAVALLDTPLPPRSLLGSLKSLEKRLGRRPGTRWGPRAIDLDILTYDELRMDDADLTLPHPRMLERAFVLVPLAEIEPAFREHAAGLAPSLRAEVVPLEGVKRSPPCGQTTSEPEGHGVVEWPDVARRVRDVAAACASAGLTRVRVADGENEVVVIRNGGAQQQPPLVPAAVEDARPEPSPNGAVQPQADAILLKSDVVGVVRMSHPSVAEGAVLPEDRELASVESLGVRNPVSSGGAGRVARVFVSDGQAVEYGQPLFAIERS